MDEQLNIIIYRTADGRASGAITPFVLHILCNRYFFV